MQWITFLSIILVFLFLSYILIIAPENQNKKLQRPESALRKAEEALKKCEATWMAQVTESGNNIPLHSKCCFFALDHSLQIQVETIPQITYSLDYSQILKFQVNEIKKIVTETIGFYRFQREREIIKTQLFLEYQNTLNEIVSCTFISGNTFEDVYYNEIAVNRNNIFTYVNARIPKQDTTITL
jgi:hypothetical protein